MEPIPIVAAPEEFNRILILLRDYGEKGLDAETLGDMASTFTHHATLPNHQLTIAAALCLGFIHKKKGKLLLDDLGHAFLAHNDESTYELAPGQSLFLINRCIFEGAYRSEVRALLKHARRDYYAKRVWIDTTEVVLGSRERALISFLRRIGFFLLRDHLVEIPRQRIVLAMALLKETALSLPELEALVAERAKRGAEAEQWVLEYEKERLQRGGFPLEASAVTIVSDIDVTAGYDLESFDGESTGLLPNRFIEVKSTASVEIVFFWSKNEIEAARSLGSQYWLYHLRKFVEGTKPELTVFQKPVNHLDSGHFSLTPWSYRVTFNSK